MYLQSVQINSYKTFSTRESRLLSQCSLPPFLKKEMRSKSLYPEEHPQRKWIGTHCETITSKEFSANFIHPCGFSIAQLCNSPVRLMKNCMTVKLILDAELIDLVNIDFVNNKRVSWVCNKKLVWNKKYPGQVFMPEWITILPPLFESLCWIYLNTFINYQWPLILTKSCLSNNEKCFSYNIFLLLI